MSKRTLSNEERRRVEKDIVNHRVESVEVGDGDEIRDEDVNELEADMKTDSDEELLNRWAGNVGEWVASQGYDPDGQLEQLIETGMVDYGYIRYEYDYNPY